jgi:putative aldouronate transport system substrate-binding protein
LIEADMIMDLTEVFDSYASETIKSYMQMDLDSFESGHKEGKLYGIPQMGYGLITQPNYIWIRKDWREEQNLDGPETMDELVEMTKRFMENYGGYGIAAEQSMDYLNMLAVAWGAHPDAWIKGDDGSLVYGSIQPEMKDALEAWAQWYQEGLLSIDFAVMDVAKMNQDVIDGKTGIMPSYQWWGWDPGIEELKNNGQNSYFEPFMIPSATGEEVLHTAFFDTTTYTVVNKNCKNPEAALKLINLYSFIVDEDTNGEKDFEWLRAFNDKGMIHATGAFKVLNPNGDYESFERVVEAVNNNDTSILTSMDVTKYDQVKIFMETGDPDQLGGYLQMGPERSSYGLAKVILDNKQYVKSALQGIMPDTLLNAGSTLDDILTEGFTKIVIGDQPIDYFDTIVESWKKAGGDQATIEMNALYNS